MANISDVARAAGVSVTTASRALSGNGRVSPATVERVHEAAESLRFTPSRAAQSLLTKKSMTVGLVVPDITNPFFPELISGAEAAARELGRTLFLIEAETAAETETALRQLRGQGVDAIILVGNPFPTTDDLEHATQGLPLVVLDRGVGLEGIPTISSDHFAGAYDAAAYLIASNHRQIVHLSGGPLIDVVEQRIAGYSAAMVEAGLIPRIEPAGFGVRDGSDAVKRLLESGESFTGLTAANDMAAIGAIGALREASLSVPGDISVVGYDDILLSSFISPPLTTVRQATAELGRSAVLTVEDLIEARPTESHRVLPVTLIERESSRRIHS